MLLPNGLTSYKIFHKCILVVVSSIFLCVGVVPFVSAHGSDHYLHAPVQDAQGVEVIVLSLNTLFGKYTVADSAAQRHIVNKIKAQAVRINRDKVPYDVQELLGYFQVH